MTHSSEELLEETRIVLEEYIEMNPEMEWYFVANLLSKKLYRQIQETEYYKRLKDARTSTKYS